MDRPAQAAHPAQVRAEAAPQPETRLASILARRPGSKITEVRSALSARCRRTLWLRQPAALERTVALATTDLEIPDLLCLVRVIPKLFTGRAKVTGRLP